MMRLKLGALGRYAAIPILLLPLVPGSPAAAATGTAGSTTATAVRTAVTGRATLTLITGDVVSYTTTADGKHSVGLVSGAGSGSTSIRISGDGAHLYAIPANVQDAFFAGTVDRALFDVRYLAENGYADAKSASLPVILQYQGSAAPATVARAARALPGAEVTASLPSIHGTAARVRKTQAGSFWRGIVKGAATTRRSGTATRLLTGGLAEVWLDRKVKAADDVSGPQIGAPAAWSAGYHGTGVKVAVLDTGVDLNHPDLAGRVVDSKVFTGEASVQDGFGHGTHVASIIAGSGAASSTRYQGVAPGARLVVGKVLDNTGSGSDSEVIAGMQWATSTGAKIVNMSLGGAPTDGTDPLSAAVNELTAATGTLFVIAAGNSGPATRTVGAPGAADAALTVAAVDSGDQIANFSSRGARIGDGALKPDIAAPGVNIVAARAAGTNLGPAVGEYYTKLSGTSMATPHVAATAAILAEQHPDWGATRLKAALMSSAKDLGDSPYEQGAGRVDIAQAVGQQVFADTTSLDYGPLPYPQTGPAIGKTITYTNDSNTPVTLALGATLHAGSGTAAPSGMLTVAQRSITVPAGGSAQATVLLDPTLGDPGDYVGAVHATADGVRLTTPVVLSKGAQLFTMTVRGIGRDGQPARLGTLTVSGIDHPEVNLSGFAGTSARVPVPAGTYQVTSESAANVNEVFTETLLINPEFRMTGDAEVVLDARQAVETRIDPPAGAGNLHNSVFTYARVTPGGQEFSAGALVGTGSTPSRILVTPTRPVTRGSFRFNFFQAYGPEPVTMTASGAGSRLTLHPTYSLGYQPDQTMFHGRQTVPVVYVKQASPSDLSGVDLRGKLALIQVTATSRLCPSEEELKEVAAAGAVGVAAFHSNFTYGMGSCTGQDRIPAVGITRESGQELINLLGHGPQRVTIDGSQADPSFVYNLDVPYRDAIPANPVTRVDQRQVAGVDLRIHGTGPDYYVDTPFAYPVGEDLSARVAFRLKVPRTIREYFGPISPSTVWQRESINNAAAGIADVLLTVFPHNDVQTQDIDDGPFVPGAVLVPQVQAVQPRFTLLCAGCREGDSFTPLFPTTIGETTDMLPVQLGAEVHLYHDGTELTNVGDPVYGIIPSFNLPPGPAKYRLTQAYQVGAQQVQTTWDYSSAGTSAAGQTPPGYYCLMQAASGDGHRPCSAEPLVLLRYQLALGIDNTLSAPGAHWITITAYHAPSVQATPPIRGLSLELSYDGGAHWVRVPTARFGGDKYSAALALPMGSGGSGVSLRTKAWDANGNQVVQTVSNAFLAKAR